MRAERITRTEAETVAVGRRLAAELRPGAIVRLHGDLGAGKTCFTRGLAEGLGVDPTRVHSPSFSLVHLYRDRAGKAALYHIDLYRVEGEVDLQEIGLEDALSGETPVAVEWPERLDEARFPPVPGDWTVQIEITARDRRRLRITPSSA